MSVHTQKKQTRETRDVNCYSINNRNQSIECIALIITAHLAIIDFNWYLISRLNYTIELHEFRHKGFRAMSFQAAKCMCKCHKSSRANFSLGRNICASFSKRHSWKANIWRISAGCPTEGEIKHFSIKDISHLRITYVRLHGPHFQHEKLFLRQVFYSHFFVESFKVVRAVFDAMHKRWRLYLTIFNIFYGTSLSRWLNIRSDMAILSMGSAKT